MVFIMQSQGKKIYFRRVERKHASFYAQGKSYLLDKSSCLLYFNLAMVQKFQKPSELIFVSIFVLLALCFFLFIYYIAFQIHSSLDKNDANNQVKYTSHILFVGPRGDADMFNALFDGANSKAMEYHAVLEKLSPSSVADERGLDTWLNYASYVDADGVIVFSDNESTLIEQPMNTYGSAIPVVSLINTNPESSQVVFLGTNKYEIGKCFAEEIFSYEEKLQKPVKTIFALVNSEKNVSAADRILSSIQEELFKNKQRQRNVLVKEFSSKGIGPVNDEVRNVILNLMETHGSKLILCFSANDTIMAAQALIDLNATGEIGIIGLYENNETMNYIEKGIVFSVISIDAFSMGMEAMECLFSLINKGHTNNYGSADLIVLRKEEGL